MKVNNLLFVILLATGSLFPALAFSQTIPDLEAQLKSASADDKPGILNQLSEAYLKVDANKAIDYGEQALKAAGKVDDVNNVADANVNLGDAYDLQKNSRRAILYYKDAMKIFDEYNQPASSALIWTKIADSYVGAQKISDAIDADTKAIELFKKANDKEGVANTNMDIGDINFKQQKWESSLPYYKNALKSFEDLKDAKGQVIALNRIGTAYSQWGNYDDAYGYLVKAIDIAKRNNLNSLANQITQNAETVKKNRTNVEVGQTDFQKQQDKIRQQKEEQQARDLAASQGQIDILNSDKIKSMAEISQLSEEAQLAALKIKAQQEENHRVQMEKDAATKQNEFLKQQKELADSQVKAQRLIIYGGGALSLLGVLLTVFIFVAYRNKRKANAVLQQKNDIIYKQKEQIEQKNMLITDSIDYARNIQDSLFPPLNTLANYFAGSFLLLKPKDIVSGDFYWMYEEKSNDTFYIAAADCTGHGVPGAFMSLLGFIMLDDTARNIHLTPAEILVKVNAHLMSLLHQNTENATGKFGMDIALIKYDKRRKEVVFAGAHNPLIIINNEGKINEIKADKVSIGTRPECSFNNQTVQVAEGDMLYLYSDGYQDQIGGEKRKKFMSLTMKELMQKIHKLDPEKQKEELDKANIEWRNKNDQTDDILVLGLKV